MSFGRTSGSGDLWDVGDVWDVGEVLDVGEVWDIDELWDVGELWVESAVVAVIYVIKLGMEECLDTHHSCL